MAHPPTAPAPADPDSALVVIQATAEVAAAAHGLGRPAVFVQQPGGPVAELLDDHALLHSLDHSGAHFADFVQRVLRPLAPQAVVTLDDSAGPSAELANDVLGVPRATADAAHARLLDAVRAARRPTAGPAAGPAAGHATRPAARRPAEPTTGAAPTQQEAAS